MRDKRPEKFVDDTEIRSDYIRHFNNYDEKKSKEPKHPKFAIYDNKSERFDSNYFFDFMENHTQEECEQLLDNCVRIGKLASYKYIGYYLVIKEKKYNFVVLNIWNKTRIPIKKFIEGFISLNQVTQAPIDELDCQDIDYVFILLKLKVLEYIRYNFDLYVLTNTFNEKIDKEKYTNIERNDFVVEMTELLRNRFGFRTLKDKKKYSDVLTREIKKTLYNEDNPRLGINKPDVIYEEDLVTIKYNQYEFNLSKECLDIYFIKQGNHLKIFHGYDNRYTQRGGLWEKDIEIIKTKLYKFRDEFVKHYIMFIESNKNKILDKLDKKINDYFQSDFNNRENPNDHSGVSFVEENSSRLKPGLEPNVRNVVTQNSFRNPRARRDRIR